MESIRQNYNDNFMEYAPNSPPSFPDISNIVGDPQLSPRLGREYQVEVPSMIKETERFRLKMNPADSEVVHDNSLSFADNDGSTVNVIKPAKASGVKRRRNSGQGNKNKRYIVAPGTLCSSWSDADAKSFLLGLFIFGKAFIKIKRFLENKRMGEILSFYYGKFYKSDEYRRWSSCRKLKGRKCLIGEKLFTRWRQQELFSRLLPGVSKESQDTLLQVSKSYTEGRASLEEYISSLKSTVGLGVLVEAVGIGKEKEDLTSLHVEPRKNNRVFPAPSSKDWASLSPNHILKYLTGGFRLSKAKSNNLFWEAVWPRLLARGWHSEQPKNQGYASTKDYLVFLTPGVQKFSRRKLVNGRHYFDCVTDVLSKVVAELNLLDLEEEAEADSSNDEEPEKGPNEDHQSDSTPGTVITIRQDPSPIQSPTLQQSILPEHLISEPQGYGSEILMSENELQTSIPSTVIDLNKDKDIRMELSKEETPKPYTIPQQITIHQQPPQQSSSPLSPQMAKYNYDFEPGFLIPSLTKRPLLQPLAQGCAESPAMILSKWPVLSLQLPNLPEPREYDMFVYRIFDRNAPIISMEPLQILTHCINQVVFPLWDTIENPRKATTQYEKRSRTYRHSSLIAGGGKITWRQGIDPYEFGNLLNDHDLHLFSTLEREKYTPIERRRMFPWFTPFQWTKMFEGTHVSVIPDVQCPQLPLKDMHKGKEIKIRRQKRIKQNPTSSIVSHLSVPETIDIMVEMLDSIAAGIEMTESDAAEFWALNLHLSQAASPASSSGLTVEEKEQDCRTICGRRSICKVESSMLNEVYHVATTGKFIAQHHEEWWPTVEDISSDVDTAIEVEKGSDFKIANENLVGNNDMIVDANNEIEVDQSSTATTSSQPLALQCLMPAAIQSSTSTGLSADEIASLIDSKLDSKIASLEQSYQKKLEESEQAYHKKLENTISPVANVIQNMNNLLTNLLQTQPHLFNMSTIPPPPPSDQTQPPPPEH